MRFVISRHSALGDVVCTLPAAGALKKAFPDCEIHWLASKRFSDIARLCSHVDTVHDWPKGREEQSKVWEEIGECEAAFDLQGLFKSGHAISGIKAGRKLGFYCRERERGFSHKRCFLTKHHTML